MEDDLTTKIKMTSNKNRRGPQKKMEENLKKNGRRPKKKMKNGRRLQKNPWKMTSKKQWKNQP